jgi:hypothetical protein
VYRPEPEADENQKYEYVSGETIQHAIIWIFAKVNEAIQAIQEVTNMHDSKNSNFSKCVGVLGVLFLIATLSTLFSDFTLLWLSK